MEKLWVAVSNFSSWDGVEVLAPRWRDKNEWVNHFLLLLLLLLLQSASSSPWGQSNFPSHLEVKTKSNYVMAGQWIIGTHRFWGQKSRGGTVDGEEQNMREASGQSNPPRSFMRPFLLTNGPKTRLFFSWNFHVHIFHCLDPDFIFKAGYKSDTKDPTSVITLPYRYSNFRNYTSL